MKREGSTIFRLPSIFKSDSTFYTYVDVDGYKKALQTQREFVDYVETLQEALEDLLNRRKNTLKARYYDLTEQLEDTKKALELYKKTLTNLEKRLKESPLFTWLSTEIQFYRDFTVILEKEFEQYTDRISYENLAVKELRKIVAEKRAILKEKNQKNLKIATQINKLTHILNNTEPDPSQIPAIEDVKQGFNQSTELIHDILKTHRSRASEGHSTSRPVPSLKEVIIDEVLGSNNSSEMKLHSSVSGEQYDEVKRALMSITKKNYQMKSYLSQKICNFNKLYDLFMEAFHFYEDYLLKSQKMTHGAGLNGSLIFLLLNNKRKAIDRMAPVTIKDTLLMERKAYMRNVKPFYKSTEGEAIDVMYKAFKNMIDEKKSKDRADEMVKTLTKDHVDAFSAIQIMGLVLLKPGVMKDIMKEFTDKNIKIGRIVKEIKIIKIDNRYIL